MNEEERMLNLFNIKKVQQPIGKNEDISFDHAVFTDVIRMIDEYEDKWYLYQTFLKLEDSQVDMDRYLLLKKLKEIDDKENIIHQIFVLFRKKADKAKFTDEIFNLDEFTNNFYKNIVPKEFPQLPEECISIFLEKPNYSSKKLNKEFEKLDAEVKNCSNSLATYIKTTYNPVENRIIKTELPSDAYNIFNKVQEIQDNFNNIDFNLKPQQYSFFLGTNSRDSEKIIMLETCKLLEKHFGLLLNPENGLFYMSNGQGKYVQFCSDNDQYFYIPLRDQFSAIVVNGKGDHITKRLIWSRKKFYSIGEHYSIIRRNSEYDMIGFKNCCFDIKKRIIYRLDPRFPRLPLKNCKINFVYDHDLSNLKNNPLKTVFEECIDPDTQKIIFKYFGRALFEQGYTQSQDVLFLMGAGGLGKTSFIGALGEIFDNTENMSADKLTPEDKFAFSNLPRADFLIMDEITNAKKHFIEKFKEMTGGAKNVPIEMKGRDPINLPSALVPRMVGIGNNLKKDLYVKFSGDAVVRRFCIIFLKRSILEAKKMTKIININGEDVEVPITKDGYVLKDCYVEQDETYGTICDDKMNEILDDQQKKMNGVQGRTKFELEDLQSDGCLEWFIQQIILHYDGNNEPLLTYDVAKERAFMSFQPEQWSAMRHLEPIYDSEGHLDKSEYILGKDLLAKLHEDVDNHLLERVITGSFEPKFTKMVRSVCKIKEDEELTTFDHEDYPGQLVFQGIKFIDEPKDIDLDEIQILKDK